MSYMIYLMFYVLYDLSYVLCLMSYVLYLISYVLCLISYTLLNNFISCLVSRLLILLHWLARPPRLKADYRSESSLLATFTWRPVERK